MPLLPHVTAEQVAMAKLYAAATPPDDIDHRVEALVHELMGRVAGKRKMLVREVLGEQGKLRFTRKSR